MPFVTLISVALAAIAVFLLFLVAFALFTPVVCSLDSFAGQIHVRWLLLQYFGPLPGSEGEKRLLLAGRPLKLRRRLGREKPRRRPKEPAKSRGRFFMRCLRDSSIRRTIGRQVVALGRGILRSASIAECCAQVSLPDPAANGMLYGSLAAFGWEGRKELRVNFVGENSLFLEFRIRLHRIVWPVLAFLVHLPYRAAFRHRRAAAAETFG